VSIGNGKFLGFMFVICNAASLRPCLIMERQKRTQETGAIPEVVAPVFFWGLLLFILSLVVFDYV